MNVVILTTILYCIGLGYITWRSSRMGFALLAALLPFYVVRLSFGLIPSTLLEVGVLTVCAVVWGKDALRKEAVSLPQWKELQWQEKWCAVSILAFLLSSIVAIFVVPSLKTSLGLWRAYFFEPLLLVSTMAVTLRSEKDIRAVLSGLWVGACGVGLFTIVQFFTGIGLPDLWRAQGRMTSVYPYPNAVGLYLVPIIIMAAGQKLFFWEERKFIRMVIASVSALIMGVAIIMSQTEAGWIAVAAGVSVLCLLWNKKMRWGVITVWGLGLVLLALIPHLRADIVEKITLHDWSGFVRRTIWSETSAMLKDHWLLGSGIGGYPTVFSPYHLTRNAIEIFQYPHSILLNFWVETGLPGMLSIVSFLVSIVTMLALGVRRKGNFWKECAILCAVWAAIIIHGLVDVPYFKNDLAIEWWLLTYATWYYSRLS